MAATCPECGDPVDPAHKPFCSRRCADVDLHKWLSGRYAIPAAPDGEGDDEGDDEPAAPPPKPRTQ